MKVTIIPSDGVVGIDGEFIDQLVLDIEPDIHAVQWDGVKGTIEYQSKPVEKITDFTPFEQYVTQAQTEKAARVQADLDADQAAIDALTVDDVRQMKIREINAEADSALVFITNAYPQSERISWDKQEQEARAFLADNTYPTPLLSAIATGRGITVLEAATKVVTKADSYVVVAGAVFGQRQALEDQVIASTTKLEVEAVAVSYTIPGV